MPDLQKRAVTNQPTPLAGDVEKSKAVSSLIGIVQKYAEEKYAYVRTGEDNQPAFALSAESKAMELEAAAKQVEGRGSKRKRKAISEKVASWRNLAELNDLEVKTHIFEALDRRKWDAEFLLIAEQVYPTTLFLLTTDLLTTISQLASVAASGNQEATKHLWLIANEAIVQLNFVSQKQPKTTREFAESLPKWPAFVSPHGDNLKKRTELIKQLRIGKRCSLDLEKRWSNRRSSAQPYRHLLGNYIDRAIQTIESTRLRGLATCLRRLDSSAVSQLPAWLAAAESLPEMTTPDAMEQWCDVALQILTTAGGGRLDGLPELKAVGSYRAGMRRRMQESEKQQQGQAEQAIRERLQIAFMARYHPISDR